MAIFPSISTSAGPDSLTEMASHGEACTAPSLMDTHHSALHALPWYIVLVLQLRLPATYVYDLWREAMSLSNLWILLATRTHPVSGNTIHCLQSTSGSADDLCAMEWV